MWWLSVMERYFLYVKRCYSKEQKLKECVVTVVVRKYWKSLNVVKGKRSFV